MYKKPISIALFKQRPNYQPEQLPESCFDFPNSRTVLREEEAEILAILEIFQLVV